MARALLVLCLGLALAAVAQARLDSSFKHTKLDGDRAASAVAKRSLLYGYGKKVYAGKDIAVGGANGWSFFADQNWKGRPQLYAGDTLVFKGNGHSVYQFKSKAAFTKCDFKQATFVGKVNGKPLKLKVKAAGTYYYGCNVMSHCIAMGQKVAITVAAAPK